MSTVWQFYHRLGISHSPHRWSHAKSWSHWLRSVRQKVVGCWVPVGRWLSSGAMRPLKGGTGGIMMKGCAKHEVMKSHAGSYVCNTFAVCTLFLGIWLATYSRPGKKWNREVGISSSCQYMTWLRISLSFNPPHELDLSSNIRNKKHLQHLTKPPNPQDTNISNSSKMQGLLSDNFISRFLGLLPQTHRVVMHIHTEFLHPFVGR